MKRGAGSSIGVGVDPKQVARAKRLAEDLIDCDPSILSLILVDPIGRVLHVSRSSRLPAEEHVDPKAIEVFGAVTRTIVGAANNAAPMMGGTEAIVGIFRKQKVLLINLQEYNLLLAIRLSRSANAEYVCDKIGDLLATGVGP